MQIVVVIPVDIPPFAAAFPDRAEGDFPQASQLAQQRRVLLAVALPEVNHFAIGGAAQAFGLVQFAFEQRPAPGWAMALSVLNRPGSPLRSCSRC